jgi:hypothetical protein
MLEKKWKTIDDAEVDIISVIKNLSNDPERSIHIGTDSQQECGFTEFVSVIVSLKKNGGSRAFYLRNKVVRISSLRSRLMKEAIDSMMIGLELDEILPSLSNMTIHIDANIDPKFKSSAYVKELVGMMVGQGFKTLVKPESWCATSVADRIIKHKI